jgi:hypothetical protein
MTLAVKQARQRGDNAEAEGHCVEALKYVAGAVRVKADKLRAATTTGGDRSGDGVVLDPFQIGNRRSVPLSLAQTNRYFPAIALPGTTMGECYARKIADWDDDGMTEASRARISSPLSPCETPWTRALSAQGSQNSV